MLMLARPNAVLRAWPSPQWDRWRTDRRLEQLVSVFQPDPLSAGPSARQERLHRRCRRRTLCAPRLNGDAGGLQKLAGEWIIAPPTDRHLS